MAHQEAVQHSTLSAVSAEQTVTNSFSKVHKCIGPHGTYYNKILEIGKGGINVYQSGDTFRDVNNIRYDVTPNQLSQTTIW